MTILCRAVAPSPSPSLPASVPSLPHPAPGRWPRTTRPVPFHCRRPPPIPGWKSQGWVILKPWLEMLENPRKSHQKCWVKRWKSGGLHGSTIEIYEYICIYVYIYIYCTQTNPYGPPIDPTYQWMRMVGKFRITRQQDFHRFPCAFMFLALRDDYEKETAATHSNFLCECGFV